MTKYTTVKAHRRKTKSGKMVNVKSHQRNISKSSLTKEQTKFIERLVSDIDEERMKKWGDTQKALPGHELIIGGKPIIDYDGEREEIKIHRNVNLHEKVEEALKDEIIDFLKFDDNGTYSIYRIEVNKNYPEPGTIWVHIHAIAKPGFYSNNNYKSRILRDRILETPGYGDLRYVIDVKE
jgi:hypothetical protein